MRSRQAPVAFAAICALAFCGPSMADCPERIGTWGYSHAGAVAVYGSTALLGAGSELRVLDIQDPSRLTELGRIAFSHRVTSISIAWPIALVTTNGGYLGGGLQVVNLSTPFAPSLQGSIPIFGATDATVVGSYAYVADWNGLSIVNIANPETPTVVGSYHAPYNASKVEIQGAFAFVANGSAGLLVVNVSDPTHPSLSATFATPTYAEELALSGHYALVGNGANVKVVDISSPTSPTQAGSFNAPDYVNGLAAQGGYAYVSVSLYGVFAVDVSNPASPDVVGWLGRPEGEDLFPVGNLLWMASLDTGLLVSDVTDRTAPNLIGAFPTAPTILALETTGTHLYGLIPHLGLVALDTTDAATPSLVSVFILEGSPYSLAISGSKAYIATTLGLEIVDISDPSSPFQLSFLELPWVPSDLRVQGNLVFLASYQYGLLILDVSEPQSSHLVGWYWLPGSQAVSTVGDRAYLAAGESGLVVLDVSNPTQPVFLGSFENTDYAFSVATSGNVALVADDPPGLGPRRLWVLDVSNPSAPLQLSSLETEVSAVSVVGEYAYLARGPAGFSVLDISIPSAPLVLGAFQAPEDGYSYAVTGNLIQAFIANEVGLSVLRTTGCFGLGPCIDDQATVCLQQSRFRTRVSFRDFEGHAGEGRATRLGEDSADFWFFSPDNNELILKVIDGTSLTGSYWVFWKALSNVEFDLRITDSQTGQTVAYHNPLGYTPGGHLDSDTIFRPDGTGPASAYFNTLTDLPPNGAPIISERNDPALMGACDDDGDLAKCFGGRFLVSGTWEDFDGHSGYAHVIRKSELSGYFWFFNAENYEMLFKILDGRPITPNYWVFDAGLTNVASTFKVVDTLTGNVYEQANPLGSSFATNLDSSTILTRGKIPPD